MDNAARPDGPEDAVQTHAPGFELPDDQGKLVQLSEFQGERSVVLYFARAFG
ncbi:MAG TPA: hypothetical protein VKU87_07375 [Thermomicrobiaceae bacterium]|nr:hypothetical protein [Thermomicrobiaceae bacterium]